MLRSYTVDSKYLDSLLPIMSDHKKALRITSEEIAKSWLTKKDQSVIPDGVREPLLALLKKLPAHLNECMYNFLLKNASLSLSLNVLSTVQSATELALTGGFSCLFLDLPLRFSLCGDALPEGVSLVVQRGALDRVVYPYVGPVTRVNPDFELQLTYKGAIFPIVRRLCLLSAFSCSCL